MHELTVIDDRQTLLDAGVRARSTLTVSLVPPYATEQLDEGAPAGAARDREESARAAAAARRPDVSRGLGVWERGDFEPP